MDRFYAYITGAVIIGLVVARVFRRDFDPFAPVWLFLTGYFQVYVIQALSNNEWALEARGVDLVTAANARALWAILWFLLVYYSGLGRCHRGGPPAGAPVVVGRMGGGPRAVADPLGAGLGALRGPRDAGGRRRGRPGRRHAPALPVPDAPARRRRPADRHRPPAREAAAGPDRGRPLRHARIHADLDVLRPAVALALRRPDDALRLLRAAAPAALAGGRWPGPPSSAAWWWRWRSPGDTTRTAARRAASASSPRSSPSSTPRASSSA